MASNTEILRKLVDRTGDGLEDIINQSGIYKKFSNSSIAKKMGLAAIAGRPAAIAGGYENLIPGFSGVASILQGSQNAAESAKKLRDAQQRNAIQQAKGSTASNDVMA